MGMGEGAGEGEEVLRVNNQSKMESILRESSVWLVVRQRTASSRRSVTNFLVLWSAMAGRTS